MGSLPEGGLSRHPDFAGLAESYDRLRPADDNWHELLEAIATAGELAGRRVLDVGCGTGRLAAALADRGSRVWGIDPSEEMLTQARKAVGRRVRLKVGRAEALPFKDRWFERAVLHLVVHLLDRPVAFRELARVLAPGGRAVVATFSREHFDTFWLNRLFPRLPEVDRTRFPPPPELAAELLEAGFAAVRSRRIVQRARVGRQEALERIRGRYISTLHLLDETEYAGGLARAERELPSEVEYPLDWTLVVADRS